MWLQTFMLLAKCPERGIPLVLLERLMKMYHKAEWALKIKELEKCTILTIERHLKNDLKFLRTHKAYLRIMQNIATHTSTGMYCCGRFVLNLAFL